MNNENATVEDTPSVFNNTNTKIIIWIFIIYFVVSIILAIFFRERLTSMQAFSGNIVNVFVFGIVIYYLFHLYDTNKQIGDNRNFVDVMKDKLGRELDDFNTVINLGIFLVFIQAISYGFNLLTLSESSPISLGLLSGIGWIYMIVLLVANFLKYFLDINISNIFASPDIVNVTKSECKLPEDDGEVFNVSNNIYSYEEARQICSSFGARLANYDEVEKSYNSGGEWCNYGWSEGQMILYPTQKDTWSVLQRNKKHANDCGRPGVNGGFIVNPYVKFGANCYGKKPDVSEIDKKRMDLAKTLDAIPKNDKEEAVEDKVKQWEHVKVSPFNKNKWSSL
mgnify:CR=1 FL=1|jgi:hypothetical protein